MWIATAISEKILGFQFVAKGDEHYSPAKIQMNINRSV